MSVPMPTDTLSIALDLLTARYGSPEHHGKISAANKDRVFTPEHRAKLSAAHSGMFHGLPAMTPEEKRLAQRATSKRHNATEHGKESRRKRERRARKWLTETARDHARRKAARKYGYAPPPKERDCPPRPVDGKCQCCGDSATRFCLDHDHTTGAFRGWICSGCNIGHGLADNPQKLRARLSFLEGAVS